MSSDVKHMIKTRMRTENLRKSGADIESLSYLVRFWSPRPGDRVLTEDYGERTVTGLSEDEEGHFDQLTLSDDNVAYLQDLFWFPTESELKAYLGAKGAAFQSDAVCFNRVFYPLPGSFAGWCQLFSQLRQAALFSGQPDFLV